MNKEEFINEIEKMNIPIDENKILKLEKYYEILIEWNEKINLTAVIDKKEVYLKHFYDSLTLVKTAKFSDKGSLCDVGTGAGFPGVVLAIFFEDLTITLVDSLNKRTKFLEHIKNQLNLNNVTIVHARAEDYALRNREKFDFVTARAVAPLNILIELCIPILKVGGKLLAMKSNISQEIKTIDNICKKLSCTLEKTTEFYLPNENSLRNIIVIKKDAKTDLIYPRKFDLIKKKPL